MGEGGIKHGQKNSDVFYGRPLRTDETKNLTRSLDTRQTSLKTILQIFQIFYKAILFSFFFLKNSIILTNERITVRNEFSAMFRDEKHLKNSSKFLQFELSRTSSFENHVILRITSNDKKSQV